MKQPKAFKKVKQIGEIIASKRYIRMAISELPGRPLVVTNVEMIVGVRFKKGGNWRFKCKKDFLNIHSCREWSVGENGCPRFCIATFPFSEKNLAFARHLEKTDDKRRYMEIISR